MCKMNELQKFLLEGRDGAESAIVLAKESVFFVYNFVHEISNIFRLIDGVYLFTTTKHG